MSAKAHPGGRRSSRPGARPGRPFAPSPGARPAADPLAPFHDRAHAGRRLGSLLERRSVPVDAALAVPSGGVPVAVEMVERLDVPLDVLIVAKIRALGNRELVLGASTPDGTEWLNEDAIARLGVPEAMLDEARERTRDVALARAARYAHEVGPRLSLEDKRVLVVDDGVATGATAHAAVQAARARGARSVMLAVPVGPPGRIEALRAQADRVFCCRTPSEVVTIGQFYESFSAVDEDEALEAVRRVFTVP